MRKLRWTLINPTYKNGIQFLSEAVWCNDSFYNLSRLFDAKLYHITDSNIDETADAYFIPNFDIALIDKEIEFAKKMKARGAKILAAYSQDVRFLHGGGLINNDGTLYTGLCEVADVISSGVNPNMKIFGRYQDKVIHMGEIIEDNDFSIPYEKRDIDLLTSGAIGEECLSFELEFLSLVKQRHPEKKVVSVVHGCYGELIEKLKIKYPQIQFESSSFIHFLQRAKVYCNPELRPRPGRTLAECYYCRVPFIASEMMYHSKMCSEFTYRWSSIVDWADTYDRILGSDTNKIISNMEERAIFDNFNNVNERIMKGFNL
jgi:hypothetical protein